MSNANETQIGGTHYKTGGEEHWDRVHRLNLDYFQGQITKYVERWKLKNGVQDLEKARHFINKYIELVSGGDLKQAATDQPSTSHYANRAESLMERAAALRAAADAVATGEPTACLGCGAYIGHHATCPTIVG